MAHAALRPLKAGNRALGQHDGVAMGDQAGVFRQQRPGDPAVHFELQGGQHRRRGCDKPEVVRHGVGELLLSHMHPTHPA